MRIDQPFFGVSSLAAPSSSGVAAGLWTGCGWAGVPAIGDGVAACAGLAAGLAGVVVGANGDVGPGVGVEFGVTVEAGVAV